MATEEKSRVELEAAVFRRLVEHLRKRTDVQNIDLMNLAGFCRNCLSKWYRAEAGERGIDQGLVDFGKGEVVPFSRLLDELIELTAPEAARFGCADEIASLRAILKRGTSAHRQVAAYEEALKAGKSKDEALKAVVDWLIGETQRDL